MVLIRKVDPKLVPDEDRKSFGTEDIYEDDVVEILVEDGELSYEEAGFMKGYNES